MSQRLLINSKEYLPVSAVAKRFGYTSDYIARLAREEKILATRIGRNWFVEPESLHSFSVQSEIEKKLRGEELSRKRKIEAELAAKKQTVQLKAAQSHKVSLMQAVAAFACCLLLGEVLWLSAGSGLTFADLRSGSQQAASLVAQSVVPELSGDLLEDIRNNFVYLREMLLTESDEIPVTALPPVRPAAQNLIFTEFPLSSTSQELFDETESLQRIASQFSDEVQVEVQDGLVVIQPVFRKDESDAYRFPLESFKHVQP